MSMLQLDFNNAEELVFLDRGLREKLPDFKQLFDQWKFSRMTPGFNTLAQRSILEFLASLTPEHVQIIEHHTGNTVRVDKNLDPRNVINLEFDVNEAELNLEKTDPKGYFSTYLEGNRLYISVWK